MMKRKILTLLLSCVVAAGVYADKKPGLTFDADGGVERTIVMPNGQAVEYTAYEPLLQAMGAADKRDDVFASVCYCPIIDLEHADMAYEWMYNCTNNLTRPLTEEQAVISNELASLYPDYLNSLNLKNPADGTPLTADDFRSYIKWQIIRGAQIAKNAGAEIPDSVGFTFSEAAGFAPPVNGRVTPHPNNMTKEERLRATAEYLNPQPSTLPL